ncbi:Uncharacterized protein B5E38_2401 [Bacillus cereus]|nr:Uncharacterized protein B5E38_2401 [Bacillus cereus]
MGKIRRTFSIDFKMKAIELYSHRGIGSKLIGKELGVTYSVIDRWIKKYENEGILAYKKNVEDLNKQMKSVKTLEYND